MKPVIDYGHLHLRRRGGLKNESDYVSVLEKIIDVNPKLLRNMYCYFAGVKKTRSGVKREAINGNPPFEPLAKVLVEVGVDATIISRSPNKEVDAIKMKEIIKGISRGDTKWL